MALGGKREGAGRPVGAINKLTRSMKEKAAEHGDNALAKLVELMGSDDPPIALKAANDLLDRGFGKPTQAIDLDGKLKIDPLIIGD